jgi:hypothetical protein
MHFDYFTSHLIGKKTAQYDQLILTITTHPGLSICFEGRSRVSIFHKNQHQFLNTLQQHLTEKTGYKTNVYLKPFLKHSTLERQTTVPTSAEVTEVSAMQLCASTQAPTGHYTPGKGK